MSQTGTWEYHFGLDTQLSAWAFQFSAIFYVIGSAYSLVLAIQSSSSDFIIYGLWMVNLIASVLFFLAGLYFIYSTYPDIMLEELNRITKTNVNLLSITEFYFTNNSILIGLWLLFLATAIFLIYPIWGLSIGEMETYEGILIILLIFILLFAELSWIFDSTADRIIPYLMSKRTTYLVQFFHDICCFCCTVNDPSPRDRHNGPSETSHLTSYQLNGDESDEEDNLKQSETGFDDNLRKRNCCFHHFGTDIQITVWIFLIVSIFILAILIIYDIVLSPTDADGYMWCLSSFFLVIGLIFLLFAVTKDELDTKFTWNFFFGN